MKNKKFFKVCKQIRKKIVQSLYLAGSGHSGPSLSIVEILVVLYNQCLNCGNCYHNKCLRQFQKNDCINCKSKII